MEKRSKRRGDKETIRVMIGASYHYYHPFHWSSLVGFGIIPAERENERQRQREGGKSHDRLRSRCGNWR